MSQDTFFAYISNEDVISCLPTSAKNKTDEQQQKIFFKELTDNKISSTKMRNLWTKAIKNLFMNNFQKLYHFLPTQNYTTSTKLKNDLHAIAKKIAEEQQLEISNASLVKINSIPLHYLYAITFEANIDFQALLQIPLESIILLSILPELGIATLWPTTKERKSKFVLKLLKSIFKNVEEIKVNALLLRKFATQETITRLGISTPQEIAGFAGLDIIEFRGSDVMLGLSGLKRRHDANVEVITRVGPFTELESDSIRLVCGKGIQIKNYEGIHALLRTIKSN